MYAWSGDVDTMDMNLQIRMANKRKEEKVAHAAIFSFGLSIKTKFIKELDQWNLQRDARTEIIDKDVWFVYKEDVHVRVTLANVEGIW